MKIREKGVTPLHFLLQSPKAECSKVGEGEGGGDGDGGGTSPPRSNWVSDEENYGISRLLRAKTKL